MNRAERIHAVELRLITREEALWRRADALVGRARSEAAQRPWLLPALAGAAALAAVGGWWVARRFRAAPSANARTPAAGNASGQRAALKDTRWVRAFGAVAPFAWPLLPLSWRSRMSPRTAVALAGIGLPLVERLLAGAPAPPLTTAPYVDLLRYAGRWHEIARLPAAFERACAGQPSADYRLEHGRIRVENRCADEDGGERVAVGEAQILPGSGNAHWRVSFMPPWLRWLPFGWAELQVLHVDADYRVALVGQADRRHLWLLARDRTIDAADEAALLELAATQGFAVEDLVFANAADAGTR